MTEKVINYIFRIGIALIFFVPARTYGQFGFEYSDSITVLKAGDTLIHPWAGGLSHAQISTVDYDFDGEDDLFIFDRSSNQIRIFLRKIKNGVPYYKFLLEGDRSFPQDLRYRGKLVDYDNDGRKDLFAYGLGGIKVYKNIGNATGGLQWELFKDPVMAEIYGNNTSLYVSSDEIPAYVDVDGDGDIDVLTFHTSIGRVEWYENLSMENYGIPDSLEFILKEPCWGDFIESGSGNTIELNSQQSPCGGSNLPEPINTIRHAGGSLLALDMNNSGLMDLVIGDVGYDNLILLINGGTTPEDNAFMISQDPNFPSSSLSVDLSSFPAGYYEDVDHDGIEDLIVGTNANGGSENAKSLWFYKNLGSSNNPNFSFIREDFLQGDMIENGKGSMPVIVDVNNDGLQDLLVANYFKFNSSGSNQSNFQYYQNIGTSNKPVFQFVQDNWNNFANSGLGLKISPTFGDLDGDNDLDMIVGRQNGELLVYENTGGTGAMNFSAVPSPLKDQNGNDIVVQNLAHPQLFDLNNDGLKDLIIGQDIGGLVYYENIGSATSFDFQLVTENLGNVDLSSINYTQSTGAPFFVRDNDTTYLFAGNRNGNIHCYNDIDGNLEDGDSFNMISDNYGDINTGAFSSPCIASLRDDDSYDLFVGGDLGGLWAFHASDTSNFLKLSSAEKEDFYLSVYPNPSSDGVFGIQLSGHLNQEYFIEVADISGRKVFADQTFKYHAEIDLSSQNSGIYILLIKNTSGLVIDFRKIVIQK